MFAKFVTSDGLPFVKIEERLYVAQLITHLLSFFKASSMELPLIYGAWGCFVMS